MTFITQWVGTQLKQLTKWASRPWPYPYQYLKINGNWDNSNTSVNLKKFYLLWAICIFHHLKEFHQMISIPIIRTPFNFHYAKCHTVISIPIIRTPFTFHYVKCHPVVSIPIISAPFILHYVKCHPMISIPLTRTSFSSLICAKIECINKQLLICALTNNYWFVH